MSKPLKSAHIFPLASMVVIIVGLQGCSSSSETSTSVSTNTSANSSAVSSSSSSTATLPADFPVTLPPQPKDLSVASRNGLDTVQCIVPDPVDMVAKFYNYQFEMKGWSLEGKGVTAKDHVVIVASKGQDYVSVTINKNGTGSSLQIVHGKKS